MSAGMVGSSRVIRFAILGIALASAAFVEERVWPSLAQASGSETYSTRGVVRSFGVDRRYVNIAHEKIAGYMEAMTMSFEPRTADQLGSLQVGDRVAFTFTATEDGRRVLQSIAKEAAGR